jgi:hypothetical protein
MVICSSIGYFTLVLVPFCLWCYVTFFTFGFFRFNLSSMPSLPPCYFIRTQVCLFLFWSSSLLQKRETTGSLLLLVGHQLGKAASHSQLKFK